MWCLVSWRAPYTREQSISEKDSSIFENEIRETNEIREEKPHRKKDAIIRVAQKTDTEKLTVREIRSR